ncbi:hypothetical protein IIA79_05340 [bacterium]|nr:hypothetical protein [bacterium]
MRIGVDTGGTFTDFAWVARGRRQAKKVHSTPDDPAQAVLAGLEEILAGVQPKPRRVELVHGTTIATNTLLTRSGARTVLLTTEGLEDVLAIGRQDRPELYELHPAITAPLVPHELRIGVRERLSADRRVLKPLTGAEVERVVEKVVRLKPGAVAICLLHSYQWNKHERMLARALRVALPPFVPVIASSVVDPQPREYERTSTTVIHAYLAPGVLAYLRSLAGRLPPECEP